MSLPRIFRTSSFRLTLSYAGLFGASVLILFTVIYWSASFYMTRQLDAAIDSDVAELEEGFQNGGIERVAALIAERVEEMPSGPMFYLLENRSGGILAGNLGALRARAATFDLERPLLRGPIRAPATIRAHGVFLKGGAYLLVGANADPLDEMSRMVLRAFGWSFALTLLLAFGGGLFISSRLLSRVEAIGRAADEIMAGHLSRRIPRSGAADEFDRLAASLNLMLERIESLIEAMRQISNDIAHDLRTPLTRLRQRLEIARCKAASPEDLHTAIDRAIAEVDAILATFGALLGIAQIESGTARSRFAAFDLSELLHTVLEVYQPMAEEKGQSLEAAIASGIQTHGDRELLAQMFANLVENAVHHCPEGAAIRLSAEENGDGVTVLLSDNGPGIPVAERQNVFRRFYRLEASRTTAGNGLGLALAAAVAALHEATIELADNHPGLRVTLRLSRKENALSKGEEGAPSEPRALPFSRADAGIHPPVEGRR